MTTKFAIFAFSLIFASPVFATSGGPGGGSGVGGSNSSSSNSGGSHSGGGAGGGGGSGGSHGGGGGGHFGGGLGGHGAATSARGVGMASHGAQHIATVHAGRATEMKHMAMQSPSKMTGMHRHHHHHPMRDEPAAFDLLPARYSNCIQIITPERPWSDCFTTRKSPAHGANSRS